MTDENLPEEKLYLVGTGENEVAMPEREMVRRIEAWYDGLSEKDQETFRKRLWARIEEGVPEDEHGHGAEAGTAGAVEGPGPDASDRPEQDPPAAAAAVG